MANPVEFEQNSPSWQTQLRTQEWSERLEYQLGQFGKWLTKVWPKGKPQSNPDFNWDAGVLHSWGNLLSGLLLSLILGLLFWTCYRLLRHYWRTSPLARSRSVMPSPAKQQTIADWLVQARRAQREGHYRLACQALYQAALQHLDHRKLVPLEASRTDGEYLAVLTQQPKSMAYQTLIQIHEQLEFGRASESEAIWNRCQTAYQDIESGEV
jgi:Domain of unknown function (DUF4129)